MNPGTLDCIIHIERYQIQPLAPGTPLTDADGNYLTTATGEYLTTVPQPPRFGEQLESWSVWAIRRANKKIERGDEGTRNGRKIGLQQVRFRIWYTGGLRQTDRIRHDNLYYDIINITTLGRRQYQDVHCKLYSNRPAEGHNAD